MKRLFTIVAAAILAGCCSCPTPCPELVGARPGDVCPKGGLFCHCEPTCGCPDPCPHLVNNPNGKCPCGLKSCKCKPTHTPQVNSFSSASNRPAIDRPAYKEVILDGFQPSTVAVQEIRRSKTNDGYMRVQVFVKNLTTTSYNTMYRFNWEDANGVEVEDPDHAWESLVLPAGDDGTYTGVAPSEKCTDFKLRMRIAK